MKRWNGDERKLSGDVTGTGMTEDDTQTLSMGGGEKLVIINENRVISLQQGGKKLFL